MKALTLPVAAISAGLILAVNGLTDAAYATHRCEDYGLKPLGMHVVPVDSDKAIPVALYASELHNNPNARSKFLNSLGIGETEGVLTERLVQMGENPAGYAAESVPEALWGIEGLVNTMLLQRLYRVGPAGNEKPIAETVLYGKIRDYVFIEKPGGGSPRTGRGHLSVDTCIDNLTTGRRDFFHWDIEIPENEFTVTPRVGDSNGNDPFPGTDITLPDAALDPGNPHSIWARDLDHKLGAKGKNIKVLNVFHRVLDMTTPPPPLTRLPGAWDDLGGDRFYISTENSCVDLFTRGFPPATFGELAGNDYCLGRCGHPAVYNSGD